MFGRFSFEVRLNDCSSRECYRGGHVPARLGNRLTVGVLYENTELQATLSVNCLAPN